MPCCERRNCRQTRRRRALRRGWTWLCAAVRPARPIFAQWLTLAERIARPVDRPGRRLAAPVGPRSGLSRNCAAIIPSAAGLPLDHRFRSGSVGAASSLVEHRVSSGGAVSRSCWRRSRPPMRCSARNRGGRRSAFCGVRRATRRFRSQTGIPPIWVSGQFIDPWLNYEGLWVAGCDGCALAATGRPHSACCPCGCSASIGVIAAAFESQLQFAEDLQRRWLARAARACSAAQLPPMDATPRRARCCRGLL